MPKLLAGPSPKQFANARTPGFAKAVRAVAGKDGRLSQNEGSKIKELPAPLNQYADNVENFFEHTGQKSVDVEKLIRRGHNYTVAKGSKAAGPDNRISLLDAQLLPKDLRDDFFELRGRDAEGGPKKLSGDALREAFDVAARLPNGERLTFSSDGDYYVNPLQTQSAFPQKFTTQNIVELFGPELTKLFGEGMGPDFTVGDDYTSEVTQGKAAQTWLNNFQNKDVSDFSDYYKAEALGLKAVIGLMAKNLSDITLIRVGPKDISNPKLMAVDDGMYVELILGQTADNKIAGVYYASIET